MIDLLLAKNLVPDFMIRRGIRTLNHKRLQSEEEKLKLGSKEKLIEDLKQMPVAVETKAANNQHYEVPPEFFKLCLGGHLKYSCCYWPEGTVSLDEAEARMLELTCKRADLEDGQDILELGCGWVASAFGWPVIIPRPESFPCQILQTKGNSFWPEPKNWVSITSRF